MPAKRPNPPRRTTGRPAGRRSLARRLAGVAAAALRLIGAPIVARPVLSSGIAGFAVLLAFVSGNAFYAQPGRHPKPMMATREGSPRVAAGTEDGENNAALMAVPLVLEVQNALARTGHYTAALDGKPGKATAAAIRAFQAENGLRVDGEPSPALLAHIRRITGAAPNPSGRPAEGERHASLGERMQGTPRATDAGEAIGTTGSVKPAPPSAPAAPLPEKELVRRIQSGLANAEVADLEADGILGEKTRAAIRTFEALEGLDVTGAPDERILKRLIEIGAVE